MTDMTDKAEVNRFLKAIEEGGLPEEEAYNIVVKFDPLLTHFLLRYLKEKHPVTESSTGPGERLLDLLRVYPDISRLAAPPGGEPMLEWFDDSYSMKTFFRDPDRFVDLIVDKMDG
ncbi:MAG: hypothetical protein H6618_05730 [Deltaproteobacteria bacterium]|nr:hypothetical protein [Deltaproteobacteria bacterium]